ncbi:GGDEF domain-containing protein [Aquabacterium sp. OR-4]|uniref:GGDEF domain-containing protein n=1 Tax=Aquabacterium sp. OR-4 TaxID=2978127 RepID=UPI0021B452CC|nr:GGDEF domain-containing protein [Aquabacterium sp. OR-4]MDT7835111.1 GGDEF domain-containing protein [Aquabacterium sp. OR-4]
MSSESSVNTPSAGTDSGRLLRHAGVVAAAVGAGGLLGYGLAHSLQQATGAGPALLGALVGAAVTAVTVPLALWARVPSLPAMPRLPRMARQAVAASPATESAKVLPLHAEPPTGGSAAQRPVRDALTGAYTQQHFVAAADREWSRLRRLNEDAALLMVDVDHFKAINEQYGQACGDAVLVEITRQVTVTLRQYDLLARFGGGVLVVYLPHTDPIGALDVAERIRERVLAFRLSWNTRTVKASVSVGVAGIGANHASLDEVIAEAGNALREAKSAGRNCVRAAPIPPRRGAANGQPLGAQRPASPG